MSSNVKDVENQSPSDQEQTTWWCKILVKIVAVIGAIAVVACSVVPLMSITSPLCIVSGVWMILIAVIIIMLEVPFCCSAFEVTSRFVKFTTNMRYWQKGLFYCLISIVPVAMCFGFTTLGGCAVPFCTGVIYGLMSLGKKASKDEMMATARSGNNFTQFENEAD